MAEFEKVAILENDFEAQLLGSILDERQIPYRMTSYHDTAYDGLYQTQKGWGRVDSTGEFKDEIMEILVDMRRQAADQVRDTD